MSIPLSIWQWFFSTMWQMQRFQELLLSKDPVSSAVQIQLVKGVGGGVDAQGHPDSVAVDVQKNALLYAHPGGKSLFLNRNI